MASKPATMPQSPPARTAPHIAITTGEPAGIGPDVTLAVLCAQPEKTWPNVVFAVLGDTEMLAQRAAQLGLATAWQAVLASGKAYVVHHPLAVPSVAGQLNPQNGAYVLSLLDSALAGCLEGRYAAMVTAPLQKSTINESRPIDAPVFTGHTEYLAEQTQTPQVVMMLAGRQQVSGALHGKMLRVALATTHVPLKDVARVLRDELGQVGLVALLKIIHDDLRDKFGIPEPRVLVTGLNPHAGEGGYLGREEIDFITPAILQAQQAGLQVSGPYPADTVFQPRYLLQADCVLAMYHDQGLAPLKYSTFGHGINVTLGLPVIRTSVDHGTALDLAGTGQADAGSMREALHAAIEAAQHSHTRATAHTTSH